MQKEKLSRLRNFACVSKRVKGVENIPLNNQREEQLQNLVNLFYLSFRVYKNYTLLSDNFGDGNTLYDRSVDFAYNEPAGFNSEEEMEDFRADFLALDAEDKFIKCCIDYYEDLAAEIKSNYLRLREQLDWLAKERSEALSADKKRLRWIKNREKPIKGNYELTAVKLEETNQKLKELRMELSWVLAEKSKSDVAK